MRKYLAVLALLLAAAASEAQTRTATLAARYDVESATPTYCVAAGPTKDPFQAPYMGAKLITSAAAPSTTLNSFVALSGAFTGVAAGDTLIIPLKDGTTAYRNVTAVASVNSITVDESIDLLTIGGGYEFRYLKHICGTTSTAGWISVNGPFAISIRYEQGDMTIFKWTIQCKDFSIDANPVTLFPGTLDSCGGGTNDGAGACEFTTTGVQASTTVIEPTGLFSQCRVGVYWKTGDGAGRDRVSVGYLERK